MNSKNELLLKLKRFYYSIIARCLDYIIPIQKKHWILGSDVGRSYREGSKYLLEYMLENHPDFTCTFITQNKMLYKELKSQGIPCEYNYSLKGILEICKADCSFTTQVISDILYSYKRKGRHHFYVIHGQPYKKALKALPQSYYDKVFNIRHGLIIDNARNFWQWLVVGRTIFDSDFISVCSDYLAIWGNKDVAGEVPIKILGMPRNDALFQHEKMKKEKWVEGIDGKFVVLYMPTHRGYGSGNVTPTPFENRPDIQEWMEENNVVLLMKNHPNMIPHLKDKKDSNCIKDITKLWLDPQVCIYHSDVLITDYSSVWMDYLIMKKPVVFYTYDDFEQNDAGVYYDIRQDPPGHFCSTEDELFAIIKKSYEDYDSMRPTQHIIDKYHKYPDGNSCERYFNEINRTVYEGKGL